MLTFLAPKLGFSADAHVTLLFPLKLSGCSSLHRFKWHFPLSKVYKPSYVISPNYTGWSGEEGGWERNDMWLFNQAVQDFNS